MFFVSNSEFFGEKMIKITKNYNSTSIYSFHIYIAADHLVTLMRIGNWFIDSPIGVVHHLLVQP